ncbi:MAG: hypothetical protein R2873_20880 [Caldilineaceae bacterium]
MAKAEGAPHFADEEAQEQVHHHTGQRHRFGQGGRRVGVEAVGLDRHRLPRRGS